LVGEAPGYMGARKTGLAFTSDHLFPIVEKVYDIQGLRVATIEDNYKELSGSHVWNVLPKLKDPPLLWNLIPLHPFKSLDNPLTNRTPTKKDYTVTENAINYFFENFEFDKIYSIGRVAEKYLDKLGFETEYVRHPSMGGSNIFKKTILNNFETI
jgi:hypothetical protein